MNKTLMAAGLAVVLGACNSTKKGDVAQRLQILSLPSTRRRLVFLLLIRSRSNTTSLPS